MIGRSNESSEGRQEPQGTMSRRKFIAAAAGGTTAVGAAIYAGVKIFGDNGHTAEREAPKSPVKLSSEATLERKTEIIAGALSEGRKITGVGVAIDYEILYPQDGKLDHPDGIRSPLILDKNTYGYTVYDQTGKASVFIAPEGGRLMEAPYSPAMEQAGQPKPNPHNATVDISPVYYESEAYGNGGRFYVTAIGEEPGRIAGDVDVMRAGEPISVGK